MNFKIESQGDGICHLSLSGRISEVSNSSMSEELSQLLGESNFNQKILLSLQNAEHIDSSGIGWLLATDKKIRAAGGELVLHSLPLEVQHVFGLMRLNKVLTVAKDRKDAVTVAAGEAHDS
jgi:anti-anti-sigma factor